MWKYIVYNHFPKQVFLLGGNVGSLDAFVDVLKESGNVFLMTVGGCVIATSIPFHQYFVNTIVFLHIISIAL